ncbi:IMPG1 protein, partial [Vireo altiloquus]|nr:IMPG1 protein [Vireo altiloquus]
EIPNKINGAEAKHLAVTSGSDKTERTTKRSRISTIRRIFDMAKHRTKRSSFFSTGVKVCPQESVKQILASHQAYYRLRVCQEAVWEAFRIFLDRIPDTSEYQNWVTACQRETFCIFDIGKNFSNSQEHLEIIQRRVKHRTFQERKDEISAEKTGGKKVEDIPSISTGSPHTPLSPNGTLLNEIVNDTKTPVKELGTNTVPELPVEQMVEFSVTLTDQEFTAELSDPNSTKYQELAAKFQLQMKKIFEKLPGFKEIRVLGFKSSSTVARYVVNFERDGSETKGTADDVSTIGSNKVESEKSPVSTAEEEGEISAAKLTVTDLQQLVATALHEDQSLPVDLGTLQFTDETIIPPSDFDNDIQGVVTVPLTGPDLVAALLKLFQEELPLGYPSPATVDQRGDVFGGEFTTESPALSEEISIPEEFNNFVTSEPDFPTKPSREPFQDRYPYTQIIATDLPSFTVPFSALGSTSSPPKSEDSSLPPPADDSAGKDLLPDGYEAAVELATEGSFATPDLLPAGEADSAAEERQELTGIAELPSKKVDQESLSGQAVKIMEEPESSGDDIFVTASTYDMLPVFTGLSDVSTVLPGAVITDVLPPAAPLPAATSPSYSPSEIMEQSLELPYSSAPAPEGAPVDGTGTGVQDIAAELDHISATGTAGLYEGEQGSGFTSALSTEPAGTTAAPVLKYLTTSAMTTAAKGKELVVFFSLRVTNMHFSDDLFNRSSTEYKALEQQFTQLLLPYLQSNLTGFKHLEILNFRNGSVIVNSKMKFARTVPYNITEAVHCVLEDFCDAAAQHLNLEIDSYSLDIEPADQADPCKFMACDKFSECVMNEWTKEADCLCKPGYASKDGLPCRSLCELEPQLCVNGGKCELVPGRGAVCR